MTAPHERLSRTQANALASIIAAWDASASTLVSVRGIPIKLGVPHRDDWHPTMLKSTLFVCAILDSS